MPDFIQRLLETLPEKMRGYVALVLATTVWLAANGLALFALIYFEHHPKAGMDALIGLHPHLHLAWVGIMVWFETHIGQVITHKMLRDSIVNTVRENKFWSVYGGERGWKILFSVMLVAICFGTCAGGDCAPGFLAFCSGSAFMWQPHNLLILAFVLSWTFIVRSYCWSLHHGPHEDATASSPRAIPFEK